MAHAPGSVTSLALGRKSARVMATGGEDRRVKLWAVGKPTCIMSLAGHTSSVDAAEFSADEDCVAAGSLSGSIRIWDLEEARCTYNSIHFPTSSYSAALVFPCSVIQFLGNFYYTWLIFSVPACPTFPFLF